MATDTTALPPITDLINNDLAAAVKLDRATWEAGTSLGITKTRSAELVLLDKALDQYHAQHHSQAALADLRYAADAWIASAPDSKREPNIVRRLLLQIASAQDWLDRKAADSLSRNPEAARALEAGRKLEVHSLKRVLLDPQWVIDHADDAPASADSAEAPAPEVYRRIVHKNPHAERARQVEDTLALVTTASAVKDLVVGDAKEHLDLVKSSFQEMCHGASPAEVFGSVGAAETFFKAAGTVFGAVASPVALLANIVLTVKSVYDRSELVATRDAFRFDAVTNPRGGFDALDKLLGREVQVKGAGVVGAAAGLAALAIPVAGAVVSSAVQAFVGAGMRARALALERQEMAAGAEMLAKGEISPELFKVCPLLGCYFLCLADTSSLVNYAKTDIFDSAFADNIRRLADRVGLSVERAREFIRSSDYALEGTEGLKGLEWETRYNQHRIEFVAKLLSWTQALRTLNRVCKGAAPDVGKAAQDAFAAFLAYDKRITEDLVAEEQAVEPDEAPDGAPAAPVPAPAPEPAAAPGPEPDPAPDPSPEPAPAPGPPKVDLMALLSGALTSSTDAAQSTLTVVQTGINTDAFAGTDGSDGAFGVPGGKTAEELEAEKKAIEEAARLAAANDRE